MFYRIHSHAFLSTGSVAALLALSSAPAFAGGFAVREQSAQFQGTSFAGDAAAGGGLSGMFWNPAVAAYAAKGYSSESSYAGIFGNVTETAKAGTTGLLTGLPADGGNFAKSALVPSSYMAYRISPDTVLALSLNSPFGLTTDPSTNAWAGQTQARFSSIKTYDFAPTIAYRLNSQLAIGVGLQIDVIQANLRDALLPYANSPDSQLKGSDTAAGFTAGISWTPSPSTAIGLGYRSAISHTLKGTLGEPGYATAHLPADSANVQAQLKLPDILTLSGRQAVSDKLSLLGTVEWTHWSDLQSLNVTCSGASGIGVFCPPGSDGKLLNSLQLGWKDSWMVALGGEYAVNRQLTVRSGAAYELSPIQSEDERTAKLPDQNRFWLSGGASYDVNSNIGIDLAYSHIWGLGGGINRTETSALGATTLVADVNSSVDIVSGAIKFKMAP